MDSRYVRVWGELARRRDAGESLPDIFAAMSSPELTAALAAAGREDPVVANLIATELLNRQRRAPYLGAFLVSVTTIGSIYALDFLYTRTPLVLDGFDHPDVLVGIIVGIGLVSLATYLMWRGSLRWLRMHLEPRRPF